jgi:cobaltochelatase CobN
MIGMRMINIDVRVKDGVSLITERNELSSEGHPIDLIEYASDTLDTDSTAMDRILSSVPNTDLIVIRLTGEMTLFKRWEVLKEKADEHSVPILIVHNTPSKTLGYEGLSGLPHDEFSSATRYLTLGGHRNLLGFLKWSLNYFDHQGFELPEPYIPPAQGAYYPGMESTDIADYISKMDRTRPVILVLFSQRKWNSGRTEGVDSITHAIERKGGTPLPIFLNYAANAETGCIGIRRIIDDYLLADGEPIVDFAINMISSSITREAKARSDDPDDPFLERLSVPVMQTPTLVYTEEKWRKDTYGLTNAEIAYDVAFPEFDGQIISIPNSSTEIAPNGSRYYSPIRSRVDDIADMAMMWAKLRHKQNREKRVAIIFYQYPPKAAHAGGAADLDTFQSIRDLLERMDNEGYRLDFVPETSEELVDRIFTGVTNDWEYVSDDDVKRRASAFIDADVYQTWFDTLSQEQKDFIIRDWGDPPGNVLVIDNKIAVPGIVDGNIIMSFQPNRGKDIQSAYHNHNCSIPHQYLSFYRWLRYGFGANIVIHVGTHGTLEWLPGKGVGLSEDCSPDYVLSQLPNLYPYVIGNPGEGTQAKRRSYAVLVDHMIPAMVRSGTYDEVEELESVLQAYMRTENMKTGDQLEIMKQDLFDVFKKMALFSDMGLPEDADAEQVAAIADDLYDYVLEFKSNIIKDGLHILGRPPTDERLNEMIYSLTRLRNGNIPSLTESVAKCLGYDYSQLKKSPSSLDEDTGRFNGEIIDDIEDRSFRLISDVTAAGCDPGKCLEIAARAYPEDNADLIEAIRFICEELSPNISRITEELDSMMEGMEGKYVRPGPSGCPTRGRAQILPTGRNFYTLDPEAVPFPASWELGKRMADQLIDRYKEENGAYPESISIVIWATDTMKTGGDDVAYILWLMGVRPVWGGYGNRVMGLEIVPLAELGRPRVDVTVNISGLFRDTFPNLTDMINEAVTMVADLDETDEENRIRAHYRQEVLEDTAKGIPQDEARRNALTRVFGATPGQYGTGVNVLISTSGWEHRKELGDYYIDVGCYAYGQGSDGVKREDLYRRRLSKTSVTVKNSTSREYDLFDNDDVFQYLGGLNSAVESVTGKLPMSVIGCSANVDDPVLRTIQEESHYVFRSKVLNPKYEQGLRRHGFRGATEILKMFEYVFGWDATSDIIENWMYGRMATDYILEEDVREWIEKANPFALHDMIDVLMEAHERGMWETSDDLLKQLQEIYMDNEEILEELTDRQNFHRSILSGSMQNHTSRTDTSSPSSRMLLPSMDE